MLYSFQMFSNFSHVQFFVFLVHNHSYEWIIATVNGTQIVYR